ncbi:LysE family translocator [uncultured Propionivibrio sp.]|uniref:LysE family translocator n=1 Tax=uncultured Propionivibrio sp. TaxID=426737 RepID=UPI0029BFEB9C|nr:LysE family translocator [uncultured Propionivibrio sp.]
MLTDLPLMTYVATMSVTPGPNNLMLAASGVNFGLRRTVPMMLGITVGHAFLVGLVAALMAWAMVWLAALRPLLVLGGCGYLSWLAWRQARAARPGAGAAPRPLGFVGAALFQWVNPKVWVMALNMAVLFLPQERSVGTILSLMVTCVLINLPCIAVWAVAGDRLRDALHAPRALRCFNLAMAALLAGTALWIVVDELF